jgi:RNA polymerase sigma factor (sigma-70 family)
VEDLVKTQEIIEGCLRNERLAQKILYERFSSKLFAVCLSYANDYADAEDILHDGFIKIFSKITQYKGEGPFEGWLRRIMVNTALERYRRKVKIMAITEEIRSETPKMIEPILEGISVSEIMKTIQGLSPQYRMVFMLYAVEGYSHKEIGKMLNISEGTSKSNYSRARVILQDKLQEYHTREIKTGKVISIYSQADSMRIQIED